MASIIRTNLDEDVRLVGPTDRLVVAADATYTVGTLTVHGALTVGARARIDIGQLVIGGAVVNRGHLLARRLENRRGARLKSSGTAVIGSAHVENDNHGLIAGRSRGLLSLFATRNQGGGAIRAVGSVLSIDGLLVNERGGEISSRSAATIEVASGVYSAGLILNGGGCTLRTASGMQVRNYVGGDLRNRGAIVNRGRIIDFGGRVSQIGTLSGHPIEYEAGAELEY